uniref:Uncharacterized protein n=1 Tax=Panagrolaimus davidi TaxID=227884 RepID=A0A914P891_9BILA
MCKPWKPWRSNKIIDQLKLDMVQKEKDQSIDKLQRQQKYIRTPSSVTNVKYVTKTSKGCGGERLVKNYKKSNIVLNSKKIWYNNGLKEIIVQSATDEHKNGFIKSQMECKKPWKEKNSQNNGESAKVQEIQLCGKVEGENKCQPSIKPINSQAQKLYDDGLLSNTKLTTDSDVIFDYPMCKPWKPWRSNKIIDQLKLDMVQKEKDQSIDKLQRQQKYIRTPSSVTNVKYVTKTSKGCGGERLVKNYKKSNIVLNSKKIWYNNGLKEIIVQSATDEHKNGFIKSQMECKKPWKEKNSQKLFLFNVKS